MPVRREGPTAPQEAAGMPPMPGDPTPLQKWRFRRNLVIYLAHTRNGLSQRLLADVFGLPRSTVQEILAKFPPFPRENPRSSPHGRDDELS